MPAPLHPHCCEPRTRLSAVFLTCLTGSSTVSAADPVPIRSGNALQTPPLLFPAVSPKLSFLFFFFLFLSPFSNRPRFALPSQSNSLLPESLRNSDKRRNGPEFPNDTKKRKVDDKDSSHYVRTCFADVPRIVISNNLRSGTK